MRSSQKLIRRVQLCCIPLTWVATSSTSGEATPLLEFRLSHARDLAETLFVLMTLGDDRAIRATYIAGEPVYERDRAERFVYPEPTP